MTQIHRLDFQPLPGLSSGHLQTIISTFRSPGDAPPSKTWLVKLDDGDLLSCEVSIPPNWNEGIKTVALVHGLGGSHLSHYMIRMSRKLYHNGYKVVRINLRGCGTGKGLSNLPYNAGNSHDVLRVLQELKLQTPTSDVALIGFSLGGNIVLKLAGELGEQAKEYVKNFIAVCPPLDIAEAVSLIEQRKFHIYHTYYLRKLCEQAREWIRGDIKIKSISEFDAKITAPLWGYEGADDYYMKCSSVRFLPQIRHMSHLLFAEDDPFVKLNVLDGVSIPHQVKIWAAKRGGHLGFIGRAPKEHNSFWMDHLLLNWVEDNFGLE